MAESDCNNLQQPLLAESEEEQRLKYFEFVQVASFHALMYAAKLYSYAKENSGPLKTGVDTVEGTVKTVVGPVYNKYHGVPVDVLKFVDRKVDESINKVQSRVPPTLMQVSTQALEAAQKAPAAARSVVSEVKSTGLVGTASGLAKSVYAKYEPAAKDLYTKYEPVAEQYASTTWRSLNQLPLFPQVAQAVAPTASYYTKKYNEAVQQAASEGWQVASHLPLVPTDKIAKKGFRWSPPLTDAKVYELWLARASTRYSDHVSQAKSTRYTTGRPLWMLRYTKFEAAEKAREAAEKAREDELEGVRSQLEASEKAREDMERRQDLLKELYQEQQQQQQQQELRQTLATQQQVLEQLLRERNTPPDM